MIVSVCAYLTIISFEPHSIYSMRLAKRGQLLTHHKDRAILTLMSLDSVIEKYDEYLYPDMDLSELVKTISLRAAMCSRWWTVSTVWWVSSIWTMSAPSCSGRNCITVSKSAN